MPELSYRFLLDLSLILLATKLFGIITRKINMPQVVGALLAGLILGPACLGLLHETEFITQLSELGVIVLMFTAGLETNVKELGKCGKVSVVIAAAGVIIPLAGGTLLGIFSDIGGDDLMQNIFIGVVLTATSVSITVETLKEMGKLGTRVSNTILGAAIIDDILGIIILTVVSSLSGDQGQIGFILLKILLFFVFAAVVGIVSFRIFSYWFQAGRQDLRRYTIAAFVFCLLLAFTAEELFGVADITGAFLAGLILSGTKKSHYIAARFDTVSYLFLSPIFFASVGINAVLPGMSAAILVFTLLLILIAVASKIVGCYIGARMTGFNTREGVQIGAGMVSRGEVALIVANKGKMLGMVSDVLFGPIIVMVVFTTIVAPVLLKLAFKDSRIPEDKPVVNPYEGKIIDAYDGTLVP